MFARPLLPKRIGWLLCLFWCLLTPNLAPAAELKIEYLKDSTGQLTRDQAFAAYQSGQFTKGQGQVYNFGFSNSAYWFYLSALTGDEDYYLELGSPLIDKVEFWNLLDPSGPLKAGESIPLAQLSEFHLMPLFHLKNGPHLLRIEDEGSVPLIFSLYTPQQLARNRNGNLLFHGLFYGLLLFTFFLSIFSYLILKDQVFFEYSLMILSGIFTFSVFDGLFRFYLIPDLSTWTYNRLFGLMVHLLLLTSLRFSLQFLAIKQHNPQLIWPFKILSWALWVNLPLLFWIDYQLASKILVLFSLAVFSGMFLLGFYCRLRQVPGSSFFLAAFFIMQTSGIALALQFLAVVKGSLLVDQAVHLGLTASVLLLVFALAHRIRLMDVKVIETSRQLLEQKTAYVNEIEHKNLELTRLDQLKDDFLANTSHELNTPLFGMIGLTENLLETIGPKLTAAEQDQMRLVTSMGKKLTNLIRDILDFSSLKNGKIKLDIRPLDFAPMARMVLDLLTPLVKDRNLKLVFNLPPDLPWVLGDESRLQQILFNLLGNAIKYTESGHVTLSAEVMPNLVWISVEDTGQGIARKNWSKLFERFVTQAGPVVSEMGSTGLGLSITLKLIELQGGELKLDSRPGQGSRFSFSLPRAGQGENPPVLIPKEGIDWSPASSSLNQKKTDPRGVKLLVIDDEPGNRALLQRILEQHGFEVLLATGGPEGLEILEEYSPDLVLLDVMMPILNGFEVSTRIRQQFTPKQLPILLLTARNQAGDLGMALEAGANDYLSKPILQQELIARIEMHLQIAENEALRSQVMFLEQARSRLSLSRDLLLQTLDTNLQPILLLDFGFKPIFANKTAKGLFAIETEILPSLDALFLPISIDQITKQDPEAQAGEWQKLESLKTVSDLLEPLSANLVQVAKGGDWILALGPVSGLQAKRADLRELVVKVMQLSVDFWDRSSGLNKFDLAEQSGVWRVYHDEGRLRTRILDKYCSLKTLPKNPRFFDVISTALFVLDRFPESSELKEQLKQELDLLQRLV